MLELEARTRVAAFTLDVALEVDDGTCLALAGPSGAGKTTVLRIAAGLLRPDEGRVSCSGEVWLDTQRGFALAAEGRRCGYVFQEYALFPHMRAWENVAYGLRGLGRRERRRRAEAELERFGIAHRADARPRELSGGERQRVALARALAPGPRALLLDEPLAALDARTRASATRALAAALGKAEVPALLVTHDFTEAALLADRVAVIDGGRVLQEGAAGALAAAPRSAFVADFAGANLLRGLARRGGDGLTEVALEGGGAVVTAAKAMGRVGVAVFPWEVAVEPAGTGARSSQVNRLAGTIVTLTGLGNRTRVAMAVPQTLVAEVTSASVERLGLREGSTAVAAWKATATRVVPLE